MNIWIKSKKNVNLDVLLKRKGDQIVSDDEEPIYEKINPKECLIISKGKDSVLVACNEDGDIKLKRVKYPK